MRGVFVYADARRLPTAREFERATRGVARCDEPTFRYSVSALVGVSPRKSATIEKFLLISRGFSQKNSIAVRKPSEPFDDIAVLQGMMQRRSAERFVQTTGVILILHIFRMRKRQVEEDAQFLFYTQVMPAGDGLLGKKACQRIRRIHVGGATEAIAGKLIEQKHECEAAVRIVQPVIMLAPRGSEMGFPEKIVKNGVESRVFFKPFVRSGLPPETHDLVSG